MEEEYDYIVVGSGAGGAPVAANLAKAGFRVLVLEAGGADEPIAYRVPAFHALATEHRDLAWDFYVKHYADRPEEFYYPRAGTLGGCTAHHAMIFVAPHNSDWDHIAHLTGDASWAADRMWKYFRRVERCEYLRRPWSRWFNGARHGYDGWLPVSVADPALLLRDPVLVQLAMTAAQTCFDTRVWNYQSPWQQMRNLLASMTDPTDWRQVSLLNRFWNWLNTFLDPNDWRRIAQGYEGPVFTPLSINNGVRAGTRELLLETMQTRPDLLTVKLHALVTRVVIENKRAVGVAFLDAPHLYRADPNARDGETAAPQRIVRARREVILSGGTFNTPQLLMLSGIGPPDELREHGIGVEVALPGVGGNLQDRYEIGVVHKTKADLAALRDTTFAEEDAKFATKDDPNFAEWLNGSGLYATNGVALAVVKRSSHGQPDPDLYLFAIPSHFSGYRPDYSRHAREKNTFTWLILKAHTRNNAGKVRLKSADPCERPEINFHYFDEGSDGHQDDLDSIVAGVEFVRKMTRRAGGLLEEQIPGPTVRSRAQLERFVKDNAWGHHACGTCKIGAGNDPLAVLDGRFRVRGLTGLRIVDASVFPRIPGFFILSAVYMVAEKASDVILADAGPR